MPAKPFIPDMVSTVITSYNKGPYLREAIESVLQQDYEPHEILVIDDGSTDQTREIARSYGDRIRYIHQENQGQCSAKNLGVDSARGEYVAFLDGDDRWRPTKLTKQVTLFKKDPALGVVYTDRMKFEGDKVIWASNRVGHELRRGRILDHIMIDMCVPFSSSMVRREYLVEVGMFDEDVPIAPDYDLWLRLARLYEFDFVDEVLVEYRMGVGGISSKIGSKVDHTLRIQQRFIDRFFDGEYPDQRVVARATSKKLCARGDSYLVSGSRRSALIAYLQGLSADPRNFGRYKSVLRALLPDPVAQRAKTLLGKSPRNSV